MWSILRSRALPRACGPDRAHVHELRPPARAPLDPRLPGQGMPVR